VGTGSAGKIDSFGVVSADSCGVSTVVKGLSGVGVGKGSLGGTVNAGSTVVEPGAFLGGAERQLPGFGRLA
jgi:hypothetical protein